MKNDTRNKEWRVEDARNRKSWRKTISCGYQRRNKPKDEKMIKLKVRCIAENIFIGYLIGYLKSSHVLFVLFVAEV